MRWPTEDLKAPAGDEAGVRVLVADDQPLSRAGLQSVLAAVPEVSVVGEAANWAEAWRLCRRHRPDVLLVGLRRLDSLALVMAASGSLWACRAWRAG